MEKRTLPLYNRPRRIRTKSRGKWRYRPRARSWYRGRGRSARQRGPHPAGLIRHSRPVSNIWGNPGTSRDLGCRRVLPHYIAAVGEFEFREECFFFSDNVGGGGVCVLVGLLNCWAFGCWWMLFGIVVCSMLDWNGFIFICKEVIKYLYACV